ncbi:CBS domain-containing protein [Pelagibius marinus]|uniref:CBS domain-containing protein n=1 Tax=Pelagibius marinus TaxID=2762760 RepID=UPI001872A04E|nr:CBS domain-containing protein [Pelagibius marinus]
MTTIKQVLDNKGHDVLTVRPDDTVLKALQLMASKNVGAVIVTENDAAVGIFTERDYARNVILKGRSSSNTPIRDIMVPDVIFVTPQQTVDQCMAIMSEKRFRHLPVMQEGKLVGIISIGDLVKTIIDEQKFTIEQLQGYIGGNA